MEEEKLYKKNCRQVERLFKKSKNSVLFLSHNVPFGSSLDAITSENSPMYGRHFGSLITKQMIEKYRPLLCVAGHIHEHFKQEKIGATLCINSGAGFEGKKVLVEVVGGKINSIEFIDN